MNGSKMAPLRIGKTASEDSLRSVFDDAAMCRLAAIQCPSEKLAYRLRVLRASGPTPMDRDARLDLRYLRAQKAAWEAYLDAAFACCMFDGDNGTDLRARLTGKDDDTFRAAMAECMVCWYLAGELGLQVSAAPCGRNRRKLDLAIRLSDGIINVEVKAPFRERLDTVWYGDDADILARCLADANKQFSSGEENLLVLAPDLPRSVSSDRGQLIRAYFGSEKIVFGVDAETGRAVGDSWSEFSADGSLLATKKEDGRRLKPDGTPKNAKIGAILCIEKRLEESCPLPVDIVINAHSEGRRLSESEEREYQRRLSLYDCPMSQAWFVHDVLVVHNPHAANPIPQDLWAHAPQLVPRGNEMIWTDNHEVFP